jgi:hypothetical protein
MRKQHKLKPTTGTYIPKRFIFFDCETDQRQIDKDTIHQVFKLGYAVFCNRLENGELEIISDLEFYGYRSLWNWVSNLCYTKSATYLIAFNIVFDLTVLKAFQMLPRLKWTLESFYSKGRVSIFRWKKVGSRLMGLDCSNFFPGKLDDLGVSLGIPKLQIDFETASYSELMTYCKRDVMIMIKGMESWFKFLCDNDCGSFKPTVASTAFNTWRHKHLKKTVHIHDDLLALELERESYKGGRTECLFQGRLENDNFYYLDINNMYGFVLQNYEFPARLWSAREDGDPWRLAFKLKKYCCIARVVLDVSESVYPYTYNDYACYPTGLLELTLTTPELKLAINKGWLKEVKAISWYRKERLFESYIKEFRFLRKRYQDENSEIYEKIVKLLINGLYGKFGQKKISQEKIGKCDPNVFLREMVFDNVKKEYFDQIWLGGTIFSEHRDGEAYHSFPAIAAHVTAYARLYLNWFVNQVPAGCVFYMDTDSLIVNQRGFNSLKFYIDPDKIGMLKIEGESSWLEINAPKDYSMEGRIRTKGIKSSAVEIAPDKYEQWQWPSLPGIVRFNRGDPYTMKRIIKHKTKIIHSGVVQPSGWIEPFHFQPSLDAPELISQPLLLEHPEGQSSS